MQTASGTCCPGNCSFETHITRVLTAMLLECQAEGKVREQRAKKNRMLKREGKATDEKHKE